MLLQRSNSSQAGVFLNVTANFVFNFQSSSKGILESGKLPKDIPVHVHHGTDNATLPISFTNSFKQNYGVNRESITKFEKR